MADLRGSLPDLAPVLAAVERVRARHDRPVLLALDGRSGVGKSTTAGALAERLDGSVVVADDFWSGGSDEVWAARTPPRRAADAIDWRRLRAEVLEPLLAGRQARWRTFDWTTGEGLSDHVIVCDPTPVVVLDGAYSARPELADLVDVAVLLTLRDELRRTRLIAREGAAYMSSWHRLWDAAEDHYFGSIRPAEAFDVVVCADPTC